MRTTSLDILGNAELPPAQAHAILKGIEGRLVRWVFACILAQSAVMAGFGYFALTHLRP